MNFPYPPEWIPKNLNYREARVLTDFDRFFFYKPTFKDLLVLFCQVVKILATEE